MKKINSSTASGKEIKKKKKMKNMMIMMLTRKSEFSRGELRARRKS